MRTPILLTILALSLALLVQISSVEAKDMDVLESGNMEDDLIQREDLIPQPATTLTRRRDMRYRYHENSNAVKGKTTAAVTATSSHKATLDYKHQESTGSITLLWFTIALLVVVLPPIGFVCIYSPGECLMAIGIGKLLIGGVLHRVHSQDPTQYKYPWHTSPYLYVITGILWILAGLWKMYIQTIAHEVEVEQAEERRRKYSFLRTKWEQDESRERRRRERERRRRGKAKRTIHKPTSSNYEMVPLNQRMHHLNGGSFNQSASRIDSNWNEEEDDEDENYMTV